MTAQTTQSLAAPITLESFLEHTQKESHDQFRLQFADRDFSGPYDRDTFQKAITDNVRIFIGTAAQRINAVQNQLLLYSKRTAVFAEGLREAKTQKDYASFLYAVSLHVICLVLQHRTLRDAGLERLQLFGERSMVKTEMPELQDYHNESRLSQQLPTVYEDYLQFALQLCNLVASDRTSTGRFGSHHSRPKKFSKHEVTRLDTVMSTTSTHSIDFEELASATRQERQTTTVFTHHMSNLPIAPPQANLAPTLSLAPGISATGRKRISARNMVNFPRKVQGPLGKFFGRGDALIKLNSFFDTAPGSPNGSTSSYTDGEPILCFVTGMGAVGKTRLAQEYANRYSSHFDWIFWANAEDVTSVSLSYRAFAKRLGITAPDENIVEEVKTWFEDTGERWLIVFDNVEDWYSLVKFVPEVTTSSGCILATTQKWADENGWSDKNVSLNPFGADAALQLLLTDLDAGADEAHCKDLALEIVQIIGSLPLFLNQARAYMRRINVTSKNMFEEYLALIQRTTSIRPSGIDMHLGYGKAPTAAFDLAFERLDDRTRDLLYVLAFLHPEGVPEDVLFVPDQTDPQSSFHLAMSEPLITYRIAERQDFAGQPCLSIHRSLKRIILDKLNRQTSPRQRSFDCALRLLTAVLPRPSHLQQADSTQWPLIEKYLPHIQSMEDAYSRAEPPLMVSIELADMFAQFGMDLYDRGLIKVGETLVKTAENVLDALGVGQDNFLQLRTNIHICIGMYTDTLGITRRNEGLDRRIQALDLREKALQGIIPNIDEDILLHNAVMDLSCSYQQFNRFQDVESLSNRCLQRFKTWGSELEYPYEFAKYFHSIAFVFLYRRDTEAAVRSAEKGAELMRTAEPGTLLTTVYRYDWAIFLFQDGQQDKAIDEHEEILRDRIARCGKSNALTLQNYMTLGIMYYFRGRYSEAETNIRKVLINCPKQYWPKENVARAKYYLSLILRASPDSTPSTPSPNANISFSSEWARAKPNSQERSDLEALSRMTQANKFAEEARTVLDELVPKDEQLNLRHGMAGVEGEAVLYDYMAPWGYRVVVPQEPLRHSLVT